MVFLFLKALVKQEKSVLIMSPVQRPNSALSYPEVNLQVSYTTSLFISVEFSKSCSELTPR